MDDARQRLIKCFSVVFQELTEEAILKTEPGAMANWDSLSWVTLLAVIQEEFGIDPAAEGMETYPGFEGLLKRILEGTQAGGTPGPFAHS